MAQADSLSRSAYLSCLQPELLTGNQLGLEREALRTTAAGQVATTPHPRAIGDKLSHPEITVDFSEGLLEFVSRPHQQLDALLDEMQSLHNFVARSLHADEMLWAMSMPPPACEQDIQIADFGRSASGLMKQVYRQGLAARYGKIMQIISGVHFNFSVDPRFIAEMQKASASALEEQDYRNQFYFRLIRGFDQHAWLLPYLFGASPIAARSSVAAELHWLKPLDEQYVHGEFATSLRMSDIGYQSPAQSELFISHKNIDAYVRELVLATRTPWPDYQKLGVRRGDDWVQLSGNILQIENEYYSAIRPKQIADRGQRPACALKNRGVSYIEVRLLDVDPFDSLGISPDTANFMQVFMMACLAWGENDGGRQQQGKHNRGMAIRHGRDPKLQLMRHLGPVSLRDWADECLDDCAVIAECLDQVDGDSRYSRAIRVQREKWSDTDKLPSQRVMNESAKEGYHSWASSLSRRYSHDFANAAMGQARLDELQATARQSLEQTAALEAEDSGDLSAYVADYFSSLCDQQLASLDND